MAAVSQGRFNTTGYDGRYLTFEWWSTQNIVRNETIISWELRGNGTGSVNWYNAGNFKVVIDGEEVYASTTRIQLYNNTIVARGTKTLKHNSNGKRSFTASVEAGIYTVAVNCYGSGSWELPNIARAAKLTQTLNFTDEQNPRIYYNNPAGEDISILEAAITFGDLNNPIIAYRSISKTDTSYTFNLTDAERKSLRQALRTADSSPITFVLKTVVDSSTKLYDTRTVAFSIVNSTPTLNPVVEDIKEASAIITQNPTGTVIKGFNIMSLATGAKAYKEATIVSQSIKCGSRVINAGSGTLENVESAVFEFSITDSRGKTTTQTIENTLINYIRLSLNVEADNPSADGEMEIRVSGNYYNGSFGTVNNILSVDYAIETVGEDDFTNGYVKIPVSISNGKYSGSVVVSGMDYQKTYKLYVSANDMVDMVSIEPRTLKTTPIFNWGENDFAFNVPISIQGEAVADWVIETGTEAMGSNGLWYWRKWHSGTAECFGTRNYGNMGVSTAWGNLYRSEIFNQNLPSGLFGSAPETIDIRVRSTDNGAWIVNQGTNPTKSTTGSFSVIRPVSGSLSAVHICFNVKGRWK